jgi:transcriptional regulator with XRE-family HTH domain
VEKNQASVGGCMSKLKITNIGKNIKEIRTFLDLTIADVSKATGLTSPAISQIENNKREPELKSVVKLMNFFNVTFERLLK